MTDFSSSSFFFVIYIYYPPCFAYSLRPESFVALPAVTEQRQINR